MNPGESHKTDTPPATAAAPAPAIAAVLPVVAPEPPEIGIEDFAKIVLKTGRVKAAEAHPNADKLLVLTIDVGGQTRTICAGIKQWIKPEDLLDKDVIIVANLKPRKMRGIDSQGMVLAITDGNDVIPLTAMKRVNSGLRVS